MTCLRNSLAALLLVMVPTVGFAQVANIPGYTANGSPPSGFQPQSFKLDCNNATPTSGQCWPLMEIWDATTRVTVNAGNSGLNVNLNGSIANTAFGVNNSGAALITGTAWGNAITSGTTQAISTSPSSANAYLVQLDQGAGFTAGAVTFQTSADGTNWTTIQAFQVLDPTSANGATIPLPYTLQSSVNKQFLLYPMGSALRLQVSTPIANSGAGTVTPFITPVPLAPNLAYPQTVSTGAGNGLLNVNLLSNASTGVGVPTIADYMGMLTSGSILAGVSGSVWGSSPTGLNVLGANVDITACAVGVCGLPTLTGNALVTGTTAAMTATTSTSLIAAVASQHIYVNSIHCNNSSATATLVQIRDGSAGTVMDTLAAGATFGGDNRNGGNSPLYWTTAGNALFAQNVTTGASVICSASGYSSAN